MSTLHQYRWQNQRHLQQHLHVMGESDDLVIYGTLSAADQQYVAHLQSDYLANFYWLNETAEGINLLAEITYNDWLNLIIRHDNSYTWK